MPIAQPSTINFMIKEFEPDKMRYNTVFAFRFVNILDVNIYLSLFIGLLCAFYECLFCLFRMIYFR